MAPSPTGSAPSPWAFDRVGKASPCPPYKSGLRRADEVQEAARVEAGVDHAVGGPPALAEAGIEEGVGDLGRKALAQGRCRHGHGKLFGQDPRRSLVGKGDGRRGTKDIERRLAGAAEGVLADR